jgi:hypothetical protein
MDRMTPHPEQIRESLVRAVDENRRLLGHIRALETLVESPAEPATGDVARRLRTLMSFLEAHVREEEEGPLYRWIPTMFPSFRDEAEALMSDHAPALAELARLAREVEGADAMPLGSPLSVQIREAIVRLRSHEARESRLVHHILAEALRAATG